MAYLTRTLIALTILTTLIFVPKGSPTWGYAQAAPAIAQETQAVITGAPAVDPTDRILLEGALGAFAAAGIDVSDVTVRFHSDDAGCGGYRGLQSVDGAGRYTVDVCVTHEREVLHTAWRTKTLLHELAHAHVESTITDAERLALMELRGLDNWNTGSWETRGAEHAAEILVWAVTDGAQAIDFRLDQEANVEATAELLLGLGATA